MRPELSPILNTLHREFENLYGPRLSGIVLYGSQARGDMTSGSDVDVMVILEGPVDPGSEITRTSKLTAALSLEYDIVLSCLFISADRFRNEQSPLLLNVRREGIPIP